MSDETVVQFPEREGPPDLKGPIRQGCAVIVDGRAIPDMHMHEHGDTVDFILDERLSFEFPKEIAYQAAAFAANAMAIGAGYSFLGAETKDRPFAPQCFGIVLGDDNP